MFTEYRFEDSGRMLNGMAGPDHGPPLVLLHGVARCWQTFLPLLPPLASMWQIHSLDFRGHGMSDRVAGRYLVNDYVEDALALVRRIDEPVVIHGHSLGAMVAAAVAAQSPERVRAVVLEDPPWQTMGHRLRDSMLHSFFRGLQRYAGDARDPHTLAIELADMPLVHPLSGNTARLRELRDPVSLRFTARCLRQLDPQVLQPIVEDCWLDGYDVDTIISQIRCPVLLIQADAKAGGMLHEDDARRVESLAADVTRVTLPCAGHLVHWSHTTQLANLMHGFLASV